MRGRSRWFRYAAGSMAAGAALMGWNWSRAEKPAAPAATEVLGGAERFLTHVSTDKPMYRAGEKVYVRAVMLNAADRTPVKAEQQPQFGGMIEIKGPKGDTVAGGQVQLTDSVLGLRLGGPGRDRRRRVRRQGQPSVGRQRAGRAEVRHARPTAPAARRAKSRSCVKATDRATGCRRACMPSGPRAASPRTPKSPPSPGLTASRSGPARRPWMPPAMRSCRSSCPRPSRGAKARSACVIEDGGISETAAKTIPILLQTVDLKVYPEGGDLVAGLSNWVYIEAKTPAQKPADIAGEVVDSKGNVAGKFRTRHEGRGSFRFSPAAGESYSLRITEPAGIKTSFPLPAAKAEGVTLSAWSHRTLPGQPVWMTVAVGRRRQGERDAVASARSC